MAGGWLLAAFETIHSFFAGGIPAFVLHLSPPPHCTVGAKMDYYYCTLQMIYWPLFLGKLFMHSPVNRHTLARGA